jgi:hypothetical protein
VYVLPLKLPIIFQNWNNGICEVLIILHLSEFLGGRSYLCLRLYLKKDYFAG